MNTRNDEFLSILLLSPLAYNTTTSLLSQVCTYVPPQPPFRHKILNYDARPGEKTLWLRAIVLPGPG